MFDRNCSVSWGLPALGVLGHLALKWTKCLKTKRAHECEPSQSGGDEEDRTPDLRIANATLSQLSYVPEFWLGGLVQGRAV